MSRWTSARVARALGLEASGGGTFTGITTDTRETSEGALFVALAGPRFDGHAFLAAARSGGARGAVVRRGTPAVDGLELFAVDDTLRALGALARERRRTITGPVVAVTGTNGKTATKEMLARVLGARWAVHATRANRNNLVGVPLTILGAPEATEALVVEAGASVPGEIGRLRQIIEPSVGVITNVAAAHTEGFGSVDGVLREKLDLVVGVALAVVGTEPPELRVHAAQRVRRAVSAGTAPGSDVRPDAWSLDTAGRGALTFRGVTVRLPVVGRHQVDNAMLALAVAEGLGVPAGEAVPPLATVQLPPGRCEVIERGGRIILDDSYNSNPASVRAALAAADALRGARPLVVVLGTMLELGARSGEAHSALADEVMERAPAAVAVVGEFVPAFARHAARLGSRLITAPDPDTLGARLADRLTGGELVLVKGSRGVGLERAIPHLIPEGA